MQDIFKQIVDTELVWEELSGPYFQARFNERIVKLRMNDFPDEILWTLIIDGQELNLEETPKKWTLPPEPDNGGGISGGGPNSK